MVVVERWVVLLNRLISSSRFATHIQKSQPPISIRMTSKSLKKIYSILPSNPSSHIDTFGLSWLSYPEGTPEHDGARHSTHQTHHRICVCFKFVLTTLSISIDTTSPVIRLATVALQRTATCLHHKGEDFFWEPGSTLVFQIEPTENHPADTRNAVHDNARFYLTFPHAWPSCRTSRRTGGHTILDRVNGCAVLGENMMKRRL